MRRGMIGAALVAALAGACGGGGSGPTGPSSPSPDGGFEVTALVFYDENGNGVLDAAETVRLPNVQVQVAGRGARTASSTGSVAVTGVPAGPASVVIVADTLPPFFTAG